MKLEELRRSKRDAILQLARNHGARNVRIFGSLARGEHSASSDIDFLVDLDPDSINFPMAAGGCGSS